MIKYIFKRLIMLIPVILVTSFLIYWAMSLTGGDPALMLAGDKATPEQVEQIREELGLNDPFPVRYANYMKGMLTGDMGKSYVTKKDVFQTFMEKLPNTLALGGAAVLIAVVVSLPLGIYTAIHQNTWKDTAGMVFALFGTSMPNFWLGLMLIIIFALKLGLLPTHGITEWRSYILPVLTLAAGGSAQLMRLTRTTMLEAIRQDFMRTAKAKGCTPACMVWKHALKNALLPVLTVMGTSFGSILGGAVICETVFAMPGLGNYILTAIRSKDIPVVMSSTVFLSAFFCLVMVVVDILYAVIDPRIREKVVK